MPNKDLDDLKLAKEAAKGISEGGQQLLGILGRRALALAKSAKKKVEGAIKNPPLTLKERAAKAVDVQERRKVRNHKIAQASHAIANGGVNSVLTGTLAAVTGAAKGLVGYLDKTTRHLAALSEAESAVEKDEIPADFVDVPEDDVVAHPNHPANS